MTKIPVLLSNDDGIHSKGLKTLYDCVKDAFDITIVAPQDQQSGKGTSLTCHTPIALKEHFYDENVPAYALKGTPVDCVKFGVNALMKEKPQLVLSGINHGANLGRTVFCSGTVGAAIEATLQGIPAIAFSYQTMDEACFYDVQKYILQLIDFFNVHPLEKHTLMNVNFPEVPPEDIKGFKFSSVGKSFIGDAIREHEELSDHFWLGEKWVDLPEEHHSDTTLIQEGYITLTPLRLDLSLEAAKLHELQMRSEMHFNSSLELDPT